jgi:hypothetical protein
MDPKNQSQTNPKTPVSEVLKQEQSGYTPTAPKASLNDVVSVLNSKYTETGTVGASDDTSKGSVAPNLNQVKIIKTFKSDAAEAIKGQQTTTTKIVVAQEKQRREQGEEIGAAPPKKHTGLIFFAIIFIALGAAAVPAVNYVLNQKTAEVPIVVQKIILPFDHQKEVVLESATRTNLLEMLPATLSKPSPDSAIVYLKFFEKVEDADKKIINKEIKAEEFASLIGPNMPSALSRSFDSKYMFGLKDSKSPKTFILFKTSSYEQTFANMLRWENKMLSDLTPIFNLTSNDRPFVDQIVINKNVRAITALDGSIILLYGFLDNETLIITTDVLVFQDINNRYITSRFVQ